jgi:hypothetical protein
MSMRWVEWIRNGLMMVWNGMTSARGGEGAAGGQRGGVGTGARD